MDFGCRLEDFTKSSVLKEMDGKKESKEYVLSACLDDDNDINFTISFSNLGNDLQYLAISPCLPFQQILKTSHDMFEASSLPAYIAFINKFILFRSI